MSARILTVMQVLPELDVGGVERGTVEVAQALTRAGHRAIVVSAPGRLVAALDACGAEYIPLAVGAKRLGSLSHISSLRKVIIDHQIDIVHARSRLPAWLAYQALKPLKGAARPAWITTVHGPYSINRYSRIMVSGDAVIAISAFIKNYIIQAYPEIDRERITVIPRGVERAYFSYGHAPTAAWIENFHASYPKLNGNALLTLPARLTRWKGQLDFIDLIAELRHRGQRVHGLIAGAPHRTKVGFEQELRRNVSRLKLDNDVTFVGHRDDLREILAASDIVYSLTGEPEAFGRTTIEALSLGTPVIGYDHGGTGEILRTVFPQGLVPVGDQQGTADRTEQFLSAPPVVPQDHPYTVGRLQEATLAVYQRFASKPAPTEVVPP